MSRSVSNDFKADVFRQEAEQVFLVLVTITHADLTEDIYIANDPKQTLSTGAKGVISNSIEYVAIPFELFLQEQSDNLITKAKIRIDNVSREILRAVREASGLPPIVNIKIALSDDPDTIEIEIPNLRMNNVTATAYVVEAELLPVIVQSEKYPYDTFNQADFPGIWG